MVATVFILVVAVVVLVLIQWRPVVVGETPVQLAYLLEELSPAVMAEGVQETVKMVLRPPGLEQLERLEMEEMVLEPIFYLEAGAEAEVHQNPVFQEEVV